MRTHRERCDQRPLDQRMGIVPHDLAVLAGAGLALVGVDDEIGGPPVTLLGHERPLESRGEPRAAAPAQAAGFHDIDDLGAAQPKQILGAVPMAAPAGTLQAAVRHAVDIGEYPVPVLQHRRHSLVRRIRQIITVS